MVKIFAEAYGKAASFSNAISGFGETGIHPFDSSKFVGQYSAAAVTDRPITPTAVTADTSHVDTQHSPTDATDVQLLAVDGENRPVETVDNSVPGEQHCFGNTVEEPIDLLAPEAVIIQSDFVACSTAPEAAA